MTDDFGFFPNQPREPAASVCPEKPCPRSSFDPDEWPLVREPFPAGLHVCTQSRHIILDALARKRTKKSRNRTKERRQQQQQQDDEEEEEEEEQERQREHLATLRPFVPNVDILYLDMGAAPARYHRSKASRKVWKDEPRTHLFQVTQGLRQTYLSEVTKLALPFGLFSPRYLHMQHVVSWILTLLPIRELHVIFGRSKWSDQEYGGYHKDENGDGDGDCDDTSPMSPPIPPSTSAPVSWRVLPPKTPQLNRQLAAAKVRSWMEGCWPQGLVGAALKSEGVLGILSNGIVVKPGLLIRSRGWE
ncbi:uncharacterized protein PpBr36_10574 [Pyricularia pennisetigena]|uniref:uncharacterized protein n=1 Tax=Pyricularia pennisetigena TaxID=1578925 RepID=UPI0011543DEA|nr:uncharacterized protein PpBr36_10574 [Pyricularia pennisetigena]TLS21254.1 hypothetical protein PpBr36_10574 [Pyricularia pennisetigena]